MMKSFIDTTFDFTSDTPHYWDNVWQNCEGLGCGSTDPDSKSPTLKNYHKLLWSKSLPNGEFLDLQKGETTNDYLIWKDFNFGSDSIINVYLHNTRIKPFIEQIKTEIEKTQKIKMEKGVLFENNGTIYRMNNDGLLAKYDKDKSEWNKCVTLNLFQGLAVGKICLSFYTKLFSQFLYSCI